MAKLSLSKRTLLAHIVSTCSTLDEASVHPMETAAVISTSLPHVARYLNNNEAAAFLSLSPRTLEKQRVIGGGPRFHKFGRRVVYAIEDLEAWASERVCDSTSDVASTAKR